MKSGHRVHINGIGQHLFFKALRRWHWHWHWHWHYYTNAAIKQPNPHFMVSYLVDSLGFSKTEALSTQNKATVMKYKRFKKDPNLVLNFFQELGLEKSHIKSILSKTPELLFYDPDKTLKPKIQVLQDIGLSGMDLIKLLMNYKNILARGTDSFIRRPIECLRTVLGSDDNVVKAIKNYGSVLRDVTPKRVESNVDLLKRFGWSDEKISRFIVENPRHIMREREWLEGVLHYVEYDLGISRKSKMFYYGVDVVSSLKKSTFDEKVRLFTSCGCSTEDIRSLIRNLPFVLRISEAKVRRSLSFLVGDLGYTHKYLASRPVLLKLSLERRLKPRYEVLKILNERKLTIRKPNLYSAWCISESKFVNLYLLPYKDEIPEMYESYIKSVGRQKIEAL